MGSTDLFAFPYPEPTDPTRDGAADIKALAEAVANMLFARGLAVGYQAGTFAGAADSAGACVVPFAKPFASVAGLVIVAMNGDATSGDILIQAVPALITTTQWVASCKRLTGGSHTGGVRVNYIAMGNTG